ncbi:hypothetical protein FPJ69_16950 [Mycobacterium tuberculosis]|nr:hypothetical protein FPJ69_16950 [Mycobacterium tuberculosis]
MDHPPRAAAGVQPGDCPRSHPLGARVVGDPEDDLGDDVERYRAGAVSETDLLAHWPGGERLSVTRSMARS